jgi:mycoredoxin
LTESENLITLYTSHYCGTARAVERILKENGVPHEAININEDPDARLRLIEINGGYASVPTLVWPDGSKLTEPTLSAVRQRLGIEEKGLGDRLRSVFRGAK